ncbi:ABC-type cobalamin/Fe3+-siderophores transport system, ATPase component [Marinitoga hydrogenitolerans DSM 16785]|uniref:ABC-type cobalamin/Fe3+-siderophores transport system, ATPase component n=2 Tax=Marinitoga TaxID=160798 RepID=A0A1M4XIL5_MARH1|nr:ABC-type cobalamin/Fe3+-siderophores transport system, ATPase component [Marinitoga hydrogenitolerans DSM 16785]
MNCMYFEEEKPIIEIRDFSLYMNNREVLKSINLNLYNNESVLIYGERNSGKSALLRSFVHLNEELFSNVYGKGDIKYRGKDVREQDKRYLRSNITYTEPQYLQNLNYISLKELLKVSLGITPQNLSYEHISLLKKLDLMDKFIDLKSLKYYNDLSNWSSADKLSLLLFVSLAQNPKVFMFDSILDHIDDVLLKKIKDVILDINQNRILIFATRNLFRYLDICNRIIVLKEGKIVFDSIPKEFIINFKQNNFKNL